MKPHEIDNKRNVNKDDALLQEMGNIIHKSAYSSEQADPQFQQTLKRKLLEKRNTFSMLDTLSSFFKGLLKPKRLVPITVSIIIIAIVVNVAQFSGPTGSFTQFTRLIIPAVHAQDNFELEATEFDSLGVQPDSSYILKSKEVIETSAIKEALVIEPNIDYRIDQIDELTWKISPLRPLPPNTILKVSLKTGFYNDEDRLQSREFSWAYQVKDTFKVLTHIPGDKTTSVPTDSGIEITFSHDNFVNAEKFVEITPHVNGKFEKHNRTIVFVPEAGLKPATIYTVKAKQGLKLKNSNETLKEDYEFSFETEGVQRFGRSSQYFGIRSRLMEINPNEKPVVQVYARNGEGKKVGVDVYKVPSSSAFMTSLEGRNKIPYWSFSRDAYKADTSGLSLYSQFETDIKESQYTNFVTFPEALPAGFYIFNLTLKDIDFPDENMTVQTWVQVTELGAYVNVTKSDSIVWVHDAADGNTVKNAHVRIDDISVKEKTNKNGLAVFTTPQALKDNLSTKEQFMMVSHAGKELIIPINGKSWRYNASLRNSDDFWRYVYTDRPKYQPTDNIKFWGLAKTRDGSRLDGDAVMTLSQGGYWDYFNNAVNIAEHKLELSDLGTFEGEIPIKNIKPGHYNLKLTVGKTVITDKYLEIRPYTKPAYQLDLTPDVTAIFAGEPVNLDAKASFFEGTPVAGLPITYTTPEGSRNVDVNELGTTQLNYTHRYTACSSSYGCWPKNIRLKINPQNAELAEIDASRSIRVFGPRVEAKTEVEYDEAGKANIKINAHHVDLEQYMNNRSDGYFGDPAANMKIEGSVTKITYEKINTGTQYDFISKKAYPTYTYNRIEEDAGSLSFVTDKKGEYMHIQEVEPETSYQVNLKIYDADGRYDTHTVHLYYYDGVKKSMYHDYVDNSISFALPNKPIYDIGEKVVADMVRGDESLPDNDGNDYLFLQLQNGLQEYETSQNSEYSFIFGKKDVPNVNLVGIRYFEGLYYSTDSSYFSSNNVLFDSENRDLKITVKADKESYKPGQDAKLSIDVKDKDGKPVQAAVNINVVDEAFYAVVNDVASPRESIYTMLSDGSLLSTYTHEAVAETLFGAEKGCFLAGTKILMADGSEKNIEDIVVGDEIRTLSDPLRATQANGNVTNTITHTVHEYLIINETLRVTPEHLVYSNHQFVEAGLVQKGDWLLSSDGEYITVETIEKERGRTEVYNFTVDPYHTYIADGFFVHNEKGDGGVRQHFTDAALFKSTVTNKRGKATITFTLPDNITSWRATAQAISDDLYVGATTANMNVTQDVFADVTVAAKYLLEDEPQVRMRAFGTALQSDDETKFTFEAPTLDLEKSKAITSQAFTSAYAKLPKLLLGTHPITYRLSTSKGKDALKLPIEVITSQLAARKSHTEALSTKTKITSPHKGQVSIRLGDEKVLQYIYPLEKLSWSWGDRVDQSVVRKRSKELINELLEEDRMLPNFTPHQYQRANGGITLLPYSEVDLELTARISLLTPDYFDRDALANYFLVKLNDKNNNREEITWSIIGLASLKQPVLPLLQNWIEKDDLTVKERLYLSLAAHQIGDDTTARNIFNKIISQHAFEKSPDIIIKIDDNEVHTRELTALGAAIAGALQTPEAKGLWSSVTRFGSSNEILLDLDELMYVQESVPHISPTTAHVVYTANGSKNTVSFEHSPIHSFEVLADDTDKVDFKKVEGDVSITTTYDAPITQSDITPDADIAIERSYYVNGQKTNTFNENDLIEVWLTPTLSSQALSGSYQVTDILPSGLLPATKVYQGYSYGKCRFYPYDIEGQKVKYIIHSNFQSNSCGKTIKYFARVRTKGSYKAEPTLLQSLRNPTFLNYSEASRVEIK